MSFSELECLLALIVLPLYHVLCVTFVVLVH